MTPFSLTTLSESPSDLAIPRKDVAMIGPATHERKARDLYPTIDHALTKALCDKLFEYGLATRGDVVWECAAGDWEMGKVLDTYFDDVFGTDIEPLTDRAFQADFLLSTPKKKFDLIITNPPFGDAIDAFIARGLTHIRRDNCRLVAFLARNELDCGVTRRRFFGECPEFWGKIVLTWRPRWFEKRPGDNGPRHQYAWYIWCEETLFSESRLLYAHKRQFS